MKKHRSVIFFILAICCMRSVLFSQKKIDSLVQLLKTETADTSRLRVLNRLTQLVSSTGDYSASLEYGRQAVELANSLPPGVDLAGQSAALSNLGIACMNLGDYTRALDYFFKTLNVTEKLGNKNHMAADLGNIGLIYFYRDDYNRALEYYFKALKIAEELNNKYSIAIKLSNIGGVYMSMKEYPRSLDYYSKALELDRKLNEEYGIAADLGNIGIIYQNQGNYEKALEHYFKALKMAEKLEDKGIIENNLGNIGVSYSRQMRQAPDLAKKKELFKQSEDYLQRSLNIAKDIEDLSGIQEWSQNLSELYANQCIWDQSLKYYKAYIRAKDSLFNEENTKKQVQLEMNYEFDKKEASAKLEQEKKEAVAAAESRKQKIVIWSVCGMLLLVAGFAVFAYRSYLQKQKANIAIIRQKHLIEEKQKEILDSIYYARRIQQALITSEKYIARNLGRMRDNKT